MKSIGAKELRLHLDEVLDRVINGEEIIINHRLKKPVKLSPLATNEQQARQKHAGLQAFDAALKKPSPFDNNKTIKQLYHDSLAQKYDGQ